MQDTTTLGVRPNDGGDSRRMSSSAGELVNGHAAKIDANVSASTTPELDPALASSAIETNANMDEGSSTQQLSQSEETEPVNAVPLSKKGQKKQARAARYQEAKLDRRAKEKERKKEKKRLAREETARKREAGEPVSEDEQPRKRAKTMIAEPFGARIVVDLGFDDMMTDKEIVSLTSQLAYTYSANRKASHPFSSLLFTSFNARTRERLERQSNAAYQRWIGTEWWDGSYEELWDDATSAPAVSPKQKCEKTKVVYLTADAEDELSELKEDEVYIIGGICDHNRYKSLCEDKAKGQSIRSARLPIGKYLAEMTTRKVLTVNQVFEILLEWVATKDWSEALYSVVPKRKLQSNQTGSREVVYEDNEEYPLDGGGLSLTPDEEADP